MKRILIFTVNLLLIVSVCFAQSGGSKFFGYKYKDSSLVRTQFEWQVDFLKINDGDTIVDVGTSSGAYIGAINVIAGFKNVHFILVDIDSSCLNVAKVNSMKTWYENLKGTAFNNSMSIVVNSADSLYLPMKSKRKLWMFNTLHEITDKAAIIKQMATVLQTGGEIIIAEVMATEKNKIHGGCKYPLMSDDEIKKLMVAAGFTFKDMIVNPVPQKKIRNSYCLFRFVKQ